MDYRVSEELVDELHDRNNRGDSYDYQDYLTVEDALQTS